MKHQQDQGKLPRFIEDIPCPPTTPDLVPTWATIHMEYKKSLATALIASKEEDAYHLNLGIQPHGKITEEFLKVWT